MLRRLLSEMRVGTSLYPRTIKLFEDHLDWRLTGRWMLLSVSVGILGALGALVFSRLVSLATSGFLLELVGYHMPMPAGEGAEGVFDLANALSPTRRWLLLILPAFGGLISGWLVFTFAPEAEGHGTDAVIGAFHQSGGRIAPRVPLIKTLASAITIGTGGSAGREGPIAQIGAALASLLAEKLGLSERERRMLLVAGVAAGVGAIFRAPLGGAFFAVEVLYRRDMESEALMPSVVAAITGFSVFSLIEGPGTVFSTPDFVYVSPLELLPLVGFAIVCAAAGILYVDIFYATKRQFGRIPVAPHLKPAIGGLLVGIIAYFFPPILGSSYGWLQQAMNGALPMALMGVFVFAKIAATSFTIGSGGSGGVFGPSIVIGGMLGGLFGTAMNQFLPQVVAQPEAYVMLGMAIFFTGVANVPIATTIMISEMTGSYRLLVPLIFGSVLVHLLVRRWSLYTQQVQSFRDSPAHREPFLPDLLASLSVASILKPPDHFHELDASHTFDEVLSVFARTREVVIPVRTDGALTGLVILDEVQRHLDAAERRHALTAADLASPFASLVASDTLEHALEVFRSTGYPELPVTDAEGAIVGFLRQAQLLTEYHRAYLRSRQFEEESD
ncbi:MAG: CIC family chloride channel protein [Rhodothermales bacterium]|jgi:CIC family chloride channel protein